MYVYRVSKKPLMSNPKMIISVRVIGIRLERGSDPERSALLRPYVVWRSTPTSLLLTGKTDCYTR